MTIEQNIKTLIGELTFQICALQTQLAEAKDKIAELEKEKNGKSSNTK